MSEGCLEMAVVSGSGMPCRQGEDILQSKSLTTQDVMTASPCGVTQTVISVHLVMQTKSKSE
jgi:hypothetical protein